MPRKTATSPSGLLAAFADPTRLRILNLLHDGDLCVGDLVQLLRVPQPTASRHLAHLRRAGLVATRKEGLWVFYALARPAAPFHAKLIECLACCFREVPELARDRVRAERLREAGGCCPLHAPCRPPARSRTARRAAPCCS
ncbi:MAG TPA: metalloregulator ArsR/SmtB family transcription factor [Planctomycetota bacterium]|nr:metalloregulator ArsR/SmtB family transcription factor [Planctomycetota bacterium]